MSAFDLRERFTRHSPRHDSRVRVQKNYRAILLRGQPLLKEKTTPTSSIMLKVPNVEPEGDGTLIIRLSWSSRGMPFYALHATIDAEKAVFQRIISGVRKPRPV